MNAVEIMGLEKHYKDFSLGPISLSLPTGCIMGLIGENGAGKSTTIKLLLGSVRPDSGSIKMLGGEMSLQTREDIGVVLDEVCFPDCLTAKQLRNVLAHTYKNWCDEDYYSLLEKLGLPLNKPFKDFSRGMKMKLGIAVAMSHKAKLLILDEPTGGLDPVVRDEVIQLFSEFTRDESHSILISSHIVSDLEKLCDYIAFIHKGRLMLCEEKDELLSRYAIVHCRREDLAFVAVDAIVGKKENPYGVSAIVRRDAIPAGLSVSPISIEELFIFMVKEG